ncbi:hypothetical protein OHB26_06810 [Nocardia sp. NBC_01503]|uniref:hypothetical protein n=1 Tax=Nocardia sp. NBC_01503 TaxID=2975997 RepID=UPI002E7B2E19|nr:hypothetical protein [Nocardia sp. NBC_01503]WTL33921.1 hypothetical protein OHB26_06810 [Nocardia sp. NBC_01503]
MGEDAKSYLDLANKGKAGLLRFTPAVAISGVNSCNTLLGHLLDVHFGIEQNIVNLTPFSGPPDQFLSGTLLAQEFNDLGGKIRDKLKEHIDTVTDMAETFRAAGKAKAEVEQQSADAFNNLTITDKPGGSSVAYPDLSTIGPPKKDPASTPAGPGTSSTDSHAVSCENAASKSWADLYHLRTKINAVGPAQAGTHWTWMADELSAAFGVFRNEIHGLRGEWEGESHEVAQASISKYADNVDQQLIPIMKTVGTNLTNLSGWLLATREAMPDVEFDLDIEGVKMEGGKLVVEFGDQNKQREHLQKYQDAFNRTYAVGLKEYNSSLVSDFPSPVGLFAAVQVPPSDPPSRAGNPASPSTVNAGSPQTPTATDQPVVPTQTDPTKNNQNPNNNDPSKTTTTDQTSQVTSLISTLAQQGTALVESLASTGSSLIQSLQKSTTATDTTTADQLKQQLAALTNLQTVPTDPGSPGGSPKSPGGGIPTSAVPKENTPQSKLFPRSTVSAKETDETVSSSRAGVAAGASATGTGTTGSTGSGMPMGSGAQAGSQGAGKEHKRPEFLRSGGNLDEVFEELPAAVLPVAEK